MADEQSRTPAEDMAQGKSWNDLRQNEWDDLQKQNRDGQNNAVEEARADLIQSATTMKVMLADIAKNLSSDEFEQMAKTVSSVMLEALEKVKTFAELVGSLDPQMSQEIFDTLILLAEGAESINKWLAEFGPLQPYIKAELDKPEYAGITIYDLIDYGRRDKDGNPLNAQGQPDTTGLLDKAIANAKIAYQKDNNQIPSTTVKRADILHYPLDKVSGHIWNLLETDTNGQITFGMENKADRRKGRNDIVLLYSINFDALGDDITITKRLTPFDKRVYIAVAALFNAGNRTISLTQIYYTMGYTGRPGTSDLTHINESISKMMGARISVDNSDEAKAYKYKRFVYDGALLPVERVTAVHNGQLVDAAINIFREPPVITFARQRQQITTISVKLLQSPVSKTDGNLLIDDYLLDRIAKAKNGKSRQHRILYKTIYEHIGFANETKTNQKNIIKRTPGKVKKYLDYYQKCGWISRYTAEEDGVTVHFN